MREPNARVYFHTLGCPKNEADSRSLMRRLAAAGASVVQDADESTHVVVNTCGFIQDAKEESIEAILSVCEAYPGRQILVMGCLVERYRSELMKGIPEVSGWYGVAGDGVVGELTQAVAGADALARSPASGSTTGPRAYAYLKISDGCDEGCTFCAIPGFKGAYEAMTAAQILCEADACLSEGARELVLVGQETTRWRSEALDLCGLVDQLSSDARVRRIRVMYLHPARLGDSFLRFMASQGKLCRYLDVPFQHSSRELLRKMGRWGDGDSYLALLDRARAIIPSVAVRSTFIVGFPGETENRFQHLLEFVRRGRFDYGGGFVYSPEEGTRAAELRPRVKLSIARKRLNLLTEAILESGERERARLVGTEADVMIDSVGDDGGIEDVCGVGRTEGQAPEVDGVTYVRGKAAPKLVVGDVVRVKISEVLGCDLVGDICAA